MKGGGGEKMLRTLKAMYSSAVAYIRVDAGCMTEEIYPVWLKQECSSLLLFYFINELATAVREKGTHGVQFVQDMVEVFLLLFEDDVVLVSVTPGGLQSSWITLRPKQTDKNWK